MRMCDGDDMEVARTLLPQARDIKVAATLEMIRARRTCRSCIVAGDVSMYTFVTHEMGKRLSEDWPIVSASKWSLGVKELPRLVRLLRNHKKNNRKRVVVGTGKEKDIGRMCV